MVPQPHQEGVAAADLEYRMCVSLKDINADCKLYLQPEWSKREFILPKIIDFVTLNPQWIISLQTHKYMNIP